MQFHNEQVAQIACHDAFGGPGNGKFNQMVIRLVAYVGKPWSDPGFFVRFFAVF